MEKLSKLFLDIKNNHIAYLSIGSNEGSRLSNIKLSLKLLEDDKLITITKKSNIYDSEPLYYLEQNHFLNLVAEIKTAYDIHGLLKKCKLIEKKMGRKQTLKKNYPRIIDLDILTYDDLIYSDDIITVPHNKINERNFVLIPFNEINPDFILPNEKKTIKKLLNYSKDNSKVRKLSH